MKNPFMSLSQSRETSATLNICSSKECLHKQLMLNTRPPILQLLKYPHVVCDSIHVTISQVTPCQGSPNTVMKLKTSYC